MSLRRERELVPRAIAGKVLADLQIIEPDEIDVAIIARYCDCEIRIGGLVGAEGRSYVRNGRAILRVREDLVEQGRQRYTIAHEIGHVRLKHSGSSCSEADLRRRDGSDTEPEANAFAAELLMPTRMFRPRAMLAEPSFALVQNLACVFRTSFTATAVRLIDLSDEPCAVIWSEHGRIKWSVASKGADWFIRWGALLSPDTLASDACNARWLPTEPQAVPGDAWIEGNDVPEDLIEETRWFAGLGAAFTLLRES